MTPEQVALLTDARLSDTARVLGLFVASKGEGFHEVGRDDFRRVLSANAGKDRVARALSDLEHFGYITRKDGGRGHSDSFSFSVREQPPVSDSVRESRTVSADSVRGNPPLNDVEAAPRAGASLSGVSYETPRDTNQQASSQLPRETVQEAGDRNAGKVEAVEEMLADAEAFAVEHVKDETRRTSFRAKARTEIRDSAAAWQDKTGSPIPWGLRPALFRLALARLLARESTTLHAAIRYVAKQELDPIRGLTSEDFPKANVVPFPVGGRPADEVVPVRPPATEVVARSEPQPGELAEVAARRTREAAEIQAWEQGHAEDAEEIRGKVERQWSGRSEQFRKQQYRSEVLKRIHETGAAA